MANACNVIEILSESSRVVRVICVLAAAITSKSLPLDLYTYATAQEIVKVRLSLFDGRKSNGNNENLHEGIMTRGNYMVYT